MADALLGPAEIRELAARLGVAPTKKLGQNFVHDPNTVRRIVAAAGLTPDDVALEVGPGLGSLTLALTDRVTCALTAAGGRRTHTRARRGVPGAHGRPKARRRLCPHG